jgi:high-affinity iron transporter
MMATLVALSIIREGSEIILYLEGILGQPENVSTVLMGSLTGAGLGISSGIVLFYGLMMFRQAVSQRIAMVLLAFFAGNMTAQAVLLLNQADWLPYTPQLWDTSSLLPEYSVAGQLLYALVGYEANPSVLQAVGYGLAWWLVVLSPLFRKGWLSETDSDD